MAKKVKPIEKRRKGFKRRGVFYCVMIVLLIIATVVLNIGGVKEALNRALYPTSRMVMIEGEKREVFSEITKEETELDDGTTKKIDVSAYYYLDENGEKVYINPYYKLNQIATVQTGFKSDAQTYRAIITAAVAVVLVIFIILFLGYLLRLSFFLSNEDAEWSQEIRDKRVKLSVFFDKLATKASGMKKNKKEKADKEDEEAAEEASAEEAIAEETSEE